MSTQPDALRLAALLEPGHPCQSPVSNLRREAAAELRRLHDENRRLVNTLNRVSEVRGLLVEQRDGLLTVLRIARESLSDGLQSLVASETSPASGLVDDPAAMLIIESEQDLINQIDAAIAKATGEPQ